MFDLTPGQFEGILTLTPVFLVLFGMFVGFAVNLIRP
jgi:hypothetical protein